LNNRIAELEKTTYQTEDAKIHFFLKVIIAFCISPCLLESTVIAQQISNNDWLRLGKEAFLKIMA
jgi:hypothetical protein